MKIVLFLITSESYNKWDTDVEDREKEKKFNLMSKEEVKELIASNLVEIGGHTTKHLDMPNVDLKKIEEDLKVSNKILEEITGYTPISFAYPWGRSTKDVREIVKKEGLKYKDLDIKEVDKIIKKEKLNFNNSRIYSSIEDLEHTFKIFEDKEGKNLPQTLDRNEIRISDILSCNQKKKYLKNCSYDFFLKIFNSSFKPRGKVFFNKTFIIIYHTLSYFFQVPFDALLPYM